MAKNASLLNSLLAKKADDLTIADIEQAFNAAGADEFPSYVMIASAFMYGKASAFTKATAVDRIASSLVNEFNDHVFDESVIDRGLMVSEINGIEFEKLPDALEKCGFSRHEILLVASAIEMQAFRNYMLFGKDGSRMWIELKFFHPHALVILKWGRGKIRCEWI